MQIHVARNSAQLGIFASEEIVAGLQSGRFLASDLAWREGMAAWTPLGDWSEFRGVGVPASAGATNVPGDVVFVLGESVFPWEISKSLSSAFASFISLFRNPAAVLTSARLKFFPTLQLVWAILLTASVFSIIGGIVHAEATAEVMRRAGSDISTIATAIPGVVGQLYSKIADYLINTKAKGAGEVVMQTWLLAAVMPLLYLLIGLLQWVGLRLLGSFGVKSCKAAALGRTAVASMLGQALLWAVLFPLALLSPQSGVQRLATVTLLIVGLALHFRVVGAALRINPWVVFGSAVLLCIAATCCCCSCCGLSAGLGSLAAR